MGVSNDATHAHQQDVTVFRLPSRKPEITQLLRRRLDTVDIQKIKDSKKIQKAKAVELAGLPQLIPGPQIIPTTTTLTPTPSPSLTLTPFNISD